MKIILKLCLLGNSTEYAKTWMSVRTEAAFALLYICVCSKEKKIEVTLLLKTFLIMAKTELFFGVWEGERCLWNVNSVIHKNLYQKARNRKKLAGRFSVTRSKKSYCCSMFMFVLVISSWISPDISPKSCDVMHRSFCTPILLQILILLAASRRSLHSFSSPAKILPTRIFFSFSYFF